MPSAWTRFRAAVNPLARRLGLYTAYPLGTPEHIGTVEQSMDEARSFLDHCGYEPQWLSAAKRHPRTDQLHDLSYRRVPNQHPSEATGTRLAREFEPQECQYHTHWFHDLEGIEVFSHYELRPDFWRPTLSLIRLRKHYRPAYGTEYLLGVTDLEL